MRIGLVCPYSWTYPGGVARHVEALAEQFLATGHEVRVLAPYDPDDPFAARSHGGAKPQSRPIPDYLTSLGRTLGIPANSSVPNLAVTPSAVVRLRRAMRAETFDVVHIHEPTTPTISWDASLSPVAPTVGTFHCYSTKMMPNSVAGVLGGRRAINKLQVRIAVSEAAAWTARRFYGGTYRIIPNGVHLPAEGFDREVEEDPHRLKIVFVGQAVERKGLPILLRAFEALRRYVPTQLTVIGAELSEVTPLLLDGGHDVRVLGKISDAEKHTELAAADLLCAPSLGGESFGMVLTEAFAYGLPVVASDIAGYRDVVHHGRDGLLVPPGDPTALAETLRSLWLDRAKRERLAEGAASQAERYAWPKIAEQVLTSYEDALAVPEPEGMKTRLGVRVGLVPADLKPRSKPERLPSLEPQESRGALTVLRKALMPLSVVAGLILATLAVAHIGLDKVTNALLASSPTWVLLGLVIMCTSMLLRGLAWHAILKAALPTVKIKPIDALQGTFIGVLMSATLPARLGEPSRALIVARRLGRARDRLPVVLGTIVSQTLLNLLALLVLAVVAFSTVDMFAGRQRALVVMTVLPLALAALLVVVPLIRRALSGSNSSRSTRIHELLTSFTEGVASARSGLRIFRKPKLGSFAAFSQLSAWALQLVACYVLLVALGLDGLAGLGAATAVLLAVNVTALLPVVPANLGVFQAACVAVLTGAYGVSSADALGYGIVLQAVELVTAVVMGMPALLREGLSWKDVRLRALHTAPVDLAPHTGRSESAAVEVEA